VLFRSHSIPACGFPFLPSEKGAASPAVATHGRSRQYRIRAVRERTGIEGSRVKPIYIAPMGGNIIIEQ
jgi:hypothetical protein